jgi:uncharacterized Zn-finger protein
MHRSRNDRYAMSEEQRANTARVIEVGTKDLPLHCPMPSMLLWNAHPRVFLDIAKSGDALCPYCGTRYKLKPGAAPLGH